MGGRDVTARNGERWHVRLVWAPRLWDDTVGTRTRRRWRRYRKQFRGDGDGDGGRRLLAEFSDAFSIDELVGAAVVGIVLAALVVLFVVIFALPLLIEVIVLAAVTLLGVAGKVLLRRPWTVAAESDDGTWVTWRVVGWSASHQHVHAVAEALEHGYALPRGGTTAPVSE